MYLCERSQLEKPDLTGIIESFAAQAAQQAKANVAGLRQFQFTPPVHADVDEFEGGRWLQNTTDFPVGRPLGVSLWFEVAVFALTVTVVNRGKTLVVNPPANNSSLLHDKTDVHEELILRVPSA